MNKDVKSRDDHKTGAEDIKWDLTDLYSSPDDPALEQDRHRVIEEADAFAARYRGKIAGLSHADFLQSLGEYEQILQLMGKIGSYAHLAWSVNTEDARLGKMVQEASELGSEVQQRLVFYDLEWLAMDEEKARGWIESDTLRPYRHYLEVSRLYKPHMLEEKQEQVLSAKTVTGRAAWNRFFDETLGSARFKLDGEELPEQQVLGKLHSSDRELRKRAHTSLTKKFGELNRTLVFVFNTILADKFTNDKLRGYESWVTSRHLSNQTDSATVDALIGAVTAKYPLAQRYYRLKRKLLGYDELFDYDRYAPLLESRTLIGWEKAEEIVMNAYSGFHPEMGRITSEFFDKRWIDAAVTPGKRGGAYSASTVTNVHPYVFMNYEGRPRDVQTLAHELGHGVHQYLSRKQGELQSSTPLTTAETASVFGEMLVFDKLMRDITDPKEKLALLMSKIDDTIATVFRQISMNRFEHAIHTARREEGELTGDQFSSMWRETQEALYGDSVTLTEGYGLWWSYIPHFLHTPGYVYAYAFGELLVLALYQSYREQEDGFSGKYMKLLESGGSDWPHKLVADMGIDISDPGFWNQGLQLFENMVNQAEELSERIDGI